MLTKAWTILICPSLQRPRQAQKSAGAIEEHEFSDSSSGQEDADPPSEVGTSETSSEPELESQVEAGAASEEESDADLDAGDAGRPTSPLMIK